MSFRPLFACSLAACVFATGAIAQTPPAPATATAPATPGGTTLVAIPPKQCVKPEIPGKLASNTRVAAFNKDLKTYSDCIKKYVEDTRATANAAMAAGNATIDEYNAFSDEIKKRSEE
jgi:hypothetical protein